LRGATATKQSTLALPLYGLLRFARNDGFNFSSSRRTPGPITTNGYCCERWCNKSTHTTCTINGTAYGSPRARGRRIGNPPRHLRNAAALRHTDHGDSAVRPHCGLSLDAGGFSNGDTISNRRQGRPDPQQSRRVNRGRCVHQQGRRAALRGGDVRPPRHPDRQRRQPDRAWQLAEVSFFGGVLFLSLPPRSGGEGGPLRAERTAGRVGGVSADEILALIPLLKHPPPVRPSAGHPPHHARCAWGEG